MFPSVFVSFYFHDHGSSSSGNVKSSSSGGQTLHQHRHQPHVVLYDQTATAPGSFLLFPFFFFFSSFTVSIHNVNSGSE
jgi:hypothetical protein